MSTYLPIALVILALFAAGCVAYIAWELSSEDFHNSLQDRSPTDSGSDAEH